MAEAVTCKGKKGDGSQCMGKDTGNGYCRHHGDQAPNNVTPITAAKSAGKKQTGKIPALAAPILKGKINDAGLVLTISNLAGKFQRIGAECGKLSKKGGGQPGTGNYGTLRDQLSDYASILGEMEAELTHLLN